MTSRQPFTPTPHAILAGTANGLAGSLPVSQVSSVVPLAQLPVDVMTNNATGVTLSGNLFGNFGGTFTGNGAGLTGVDLLSANARGAIAWTTNAWSMTALPVGQNPMAVVAADLHGTGKLDLISANHNDNSLTIWNNNGHGGFVNSATISLGVAFRPIRLPRRTSMATASWILFAQSTNRTPRHGAG